MKEAEARVAEETGGGGVVESAEGGGPSHDCCTIDARLSKPLENLVKAGRLTAGVATAAQPFMITPATTIQEDIITAAPR